MYARTLICILCAVVLVPTSGWAQTAAGRPQATAVLTIKSLDTLRAASKYVGRLAGKPEAGKAIDNAISMVTGTQEIPGLDTRKPFGVVFLTRGGADGWPLVFLPVQDANKITQTLQKVAPTLAAFAGPQPSKVQGRWLFIGPALNHLSARELPQPSQVIPASARESDIALSVRFGAMPEFFESMVLAQIRQRLASSRGTAAYRAGQEFGMHAMEKLFTEVEDLTFGLSLSPTRRNLVVDIAATAKRGTDLAKSLSAPKVPGRFASLVDSSAAFTLLLNTQLQEQQKQQILAALPSPRPISAGFGGSAKQNPADEVLTLLRQTVERGDLQLGISLRGTPPGPITLVLAAAVANAKSLESCIVRMSEDDQKKGQVRFKEAAKRIQGVPVHELKFLKVPKDMRQIFGRNPTLNFGADQDALYLTMGGKALPNMKWALDRTHSSRRFSHRFSPLVVQARIRPWLDLAVKEKPELESIRTQISQSERISFSVTPTSGGMRTRIEIQEGLLRLLATESARKQERNLMRSR